MEKEDNGKKNDNEQWFKSQCEPGKTAEAREKKLEIMRRAFRVEVVDLTGISTLFGSTSGVVARFVVDYGKTRLGCSVHSLEQLWPHTPV